MKKMHIILIAVVILSLGMHQVIIVQMMKYTDADHVQGGIAIANALTGDVVEDSIALAISEGVPAVYGPELGVSFSSVQGSMNILRQYDPTYGTDEKKITLTGTDLERYIDIGMRISCEYCCGAKSIVFPDGSAACGCAHSIAMRGLIAYLLTTHGTEYTNDEILRELAQWKAMFFPKQMIQKMATALTTGTYTQDIAALVLNKELPQYSASSKNAPVPSEITNLPSMVGGC